MHCISSGIGVSVADWIRSGLVLGNSLLGFHSPWSLNNVHVSVSTYFSVQVFIHLIILTGAYMAGIVLNKPLILLVSQKRKFKNIIEY